MYHRVNNMNRGSFNNQIVGQRPQNFDARFDQFEDRLQNPAIQTGTHNAMIRHFTQNQQPTAMKIFNFSVGLKHEQRAPDGVEGVASQAKTDQPRRLLQIVLNMLPTTQVRLHVYDCDCPRYVALRLTELLKYENLLQITEPNNINLFRESLQNFI